jgi:hypothetical protein
LLLIVIPFSPIAAHSKMKKGITYVTNNLGLEDEVSDCSITNPSEKVYVFSHIKYFDRLVSYFVTYIDL